MPNTIKNAYNHKRLAIIFAVASGCLYSLWLLGYQLNPAVMNKLDLSALQAAGQPYRNLFMLGDIVTGFMSLGLAYCLWKIFYRSRALKKQSAWLCISGVFLFGVFTAVSSILPSCIASSRVCNTQASNLLDVHNVTATLASLGIFISMVSLFVLSFRKMRQGWYLWLLVLLITWSVSGILFIILSIKLNLFSFTLQQIFLLLSSLCLVVIPVIINMNSASKESHKPAEIAT